MATAPSLAPQRDRAAVSASDDAFAAHAMRRNNSHRLVQFSRTVDVWLTICPIPLLKELMAATRLSRRQVERNCMALYGKPPKVLAREARALRAATAITADPEYGCDFVEHGFYDQSHMIREVKHFTGATPGQIRARARADKAGQIVAESERLDHARRCRQFRVQYRLLASGAHG